MLSLERVRLVLPEIGARAIGERGSTGDRVANSAFPFGHYYSPIPDLGELRAEPRRSQVWPATSRDTVRIAWRVAAQRRLCRDVFAMHPRLQWPRVQAGSGEAIYAYANPMYPPLDAWILDGMLRWRAPRRLPEVGSGASSLVAARVGTEALGGALELTCVDPNPPEFLTEGVEGIDELIAQPVQDIGLARFQGLERNDVLVIDTSHTVKTGGDVPWLYNESSLASAQASWFISTTSSCRTTIPSRGLSVGGEGMSSTCAELPCLQPGVRGDLRGRLHGDPSSRRPDERLSRISALRRARR